jgi:hypothetical protein
MHAKQTQRNRNGHPTDKHTCSLIKTIPSNIRNDLKLSYFYQRFTEAYGIPVIGSSKVSTNGLRRACYVLRFYLANNNEVREAFYKKNVRIIVLTRGETVHNLPEMSTMPVYYNSVKGLSATPYAPFVVVNEESFQCSNEKHK